MYSEQEHTPMSENIETKFSLVEAEQTEDSALIVMQWRNDPETLEMFYHHEPKIWPDFHQEYIHTYFEGPLELVPLFGTIQGVKVAFLRFGNIDPVAGWNQPACDISINIAPEHRGKGYGALAITEACKLLSAKGIGSIHAEVRIRNISSAKSFEKAGFKNLGSEIITIPHSGEVAEIYKFAINL